LASSKIDFSSLDSKRARTAAGLGAILAIVAVWSSGPLALTAALLGIILVASLSDLSEGMSRFVGLTYAFTWTTSLQLAVALVALLSWRSGFLVSGIADVPFARLTLNLLAGAILKSMVALGVLGLFARTFYWSSDRAESYRSAASRSETPPPEPALAWLLAQTQIVCGAALLWESLVLLDL
jgi:hypothetical protein